MDVSLLKDIFKKQSSCLYGTYVKPASAFSSVDFPAPDGPIIATNSPDLNSPLMPCRISFSPATKTYEIAII